MADSVQEDAEEYKIHTQGHFPDFLEVSWFLVRDEPTFYVIRENLSRDLEWFSLVQI